MARSQNPSIEILEIALRALGPICDDLEDAICVLDGRSELEDEIEGAADDVREYVCSRLRDLLEDTRFREALAGHLPGDPGSQARLPNLVARLERLAAIQAD